jgi:uncharacterized protein YidB (DUF937 family)
MGLLDTLASTLNANSGSATAAGGQVAGQETGQETGQATGKGGAILSEVLVALQNPQSGGLSGVLQSFEHAGLGHLTQSWVGTGQNLPASPDQIQSGLGAGLLQKIAQATGVPAAEVTQHLSALLPQIVDHLTPNGQVPHQSEVGSVLSGLAQKFLRS